MKKVQIGLSKLYGRFISFCLKRRWAKTKRGAGMIFSVMSILEKFTYYKNTYDGQTRGHYVPQFILKKFKASDDQSKLGFVYSFSTNDKSITDKKIANAAQEPDFYIFEDTLGNKSDYGERQVYGKLEDSMSRVLRYLLDIKKTEDFTHLESSIIATFIAHQITRTPFFYENLKKFISFLITEKDLDWKNDLFIADRLKQHAVEKIIINNSFDITQEQLNCYRNPLTMKGGNINSIMSALSMSIANAICEDIHKKNILIVDTTATTYRFVISDNPILFFNYSQGWLNFPAWWEMRNEDLVLGMPLAPDKAIILHPGLRKDGKNFLSDQEDQLMFNEMINSYQFGNAHLEIFSDNKEYLRAQSEHYSEVIDSPFVSSRL